MRPSKDYVKLREKYLTPRIREKLLGLPDTTADYFTSTADLPKAFRVGECKVVEPGRRVNFDVLLFWKTDTRSEQQSIKVAAVNSDGKWLVDGVGEDAN